MCCVLCVITMVSQQQQQRNDDDHLSSSAATDGNVPSSPAERRRIIPKSISWLLVILILAAVNIWYTSKDFLPTISSFTGDNDHNSNNVVMMEGQTNFTEHRAPPVVVQSTQHNMQMQNNVTRHERIIASRNHSSTTKSKVNYTDDSSIKIESSGCNWCQGDSRIFNPSIRVHGGLTCSDIKQFIDNGEVQHCEAFQTVQSLCCPTAN